MSYSTLEDCREAAGSQAVLAQLVPDPDDETQVHVKTLAIYQSKADALIDSYLNMRYSTPLTAPSRAIIDCAAELTIYFLRSRPGRAHGIGEADVEAHKARLDWLKDMRDGRLRPSEPLPPRSSAVRATVVELGGSVTKDEFKY